MAGNQWQQKIRLCHVVIITHHVVGEEIIYKGEREGGGGGGGGVLRLTITIIQVNSVRKGGMVQCGGRRDSQSRSYPPEPREGGRRSPAVACWASNHWVASSNHSGASFVINFASLSPASAWPSLA